MKDLYIQISLVLSLLVTMAFTISNSAHEVEEALNGIRLFYENHPTIYQEITYQLYANHTSDDLHSSESGLLILDQGVKYSKLGPIESLTNKDFNIGVDYEEKTMMISNNFSNLSIDPLKSITAYLEQLNSASVKSISSEVNLLTLQMESGEIAAAQIYYLKDDFQIEKIIFKYRREIQLEDPEDSDWVQPRLEIIYSNTSFEGRGKTLLDMNNYVKRAAKNWTAIGKYSGYELIVNLHDNPFKQ